jgi:hypothetical protein
MIIKHTAIPKRHHPNMHMQTEIASRCQRPPLSHLAHELINQLTVLNLVGSQILSRFRARSDCELDREAEMFARSIQEATLLVQQLADHLVSQEELAHRKAHRARPAEGQIVRFLRKVSDNKL